MKAETAAQCKAWVEALQKLIMRVRCSSMPPNVGQQRSLYPRLLCSIVLCRVFAVG